MPYITTILLMLSQIINTGLYAMKVDIQISITVTIFTTLLSLAILSQGKN